CAKWILYGDFW
nr:immunoglobulin heavy chain junction region [Mus musculus]